MKKLHIFYDKNCKAKVPPVKEALEGVFGLDTTEENLLNLAEGAYDTNRMQYEASNLLNYLSRSKTRSKSLCLWLISEDIYVHGMNFVFGVAQPGKAAVISTHRLDSLELIKKGSYSRNGACFVATAL